MRFAPGFPDHRDDSDHASQINHAICQATANRFTGHRFNALVWLCKEIGLGSLDLICNFPDLYGRTEV